MSDFFQNGVIATLHRLGREPLEKLEARLEEHVESAPVALVLPCLVSELEGVALPRIVQHLTRVTWLKEIVVALDRADRRAFAEARRFFAPLGKRCRILWIDGPGVQAQIRLLAEHGLEVGAPGKGRGSWLSFGYVLARAQSRIIALHDCDILTYDRSLLARLCYPLADQSLGYEYAKGYYARVTERMHGRVTRLFLTPLVRALSQLVGPVPVLAYLDSFRYALAGEFAMYADLARSVRIPSDWGLEIGMLFEVYRNTAFRRVCQVDVADNYDHKHQVLSSDDASAGLNRMARDISKTLLRTLAMEGVVFGQGFYTTLRITYLRIAQDTVKVYNDDAAINALAFDRHAESVAIEMFARALRRACDEFEADPMAYVGLPDWNRITAAIPDFLERYRDAVDAEID
jgi:glucosyl-3-phosphoglycerate synthase